MESLLTDPKFAPEVVKLLEAKLLTLTSELEDVKKENFELRSAADSTSHLPGLEEVFVPPVYTIFEDLDKLCATVAATPSADFQTGIATIRDEYHRCASALEELRKTHWDAEKRLEEVRKKLEGYVPFDDELHPERMSDTGDDHGVDFRATAPSTIYPACLSILENVPCAESVPLRSELQALFEKGIRMNDHCMPRVLKTTCKGEGPLSLRSRVYWPSELGQHAILVSPAERYQQDEKWEPYNELQAYAGRTYELFYNDDDADGKISYAGTYKCLSITTLPSECYEKLPDSTCRELFRIARFPFFPYNASDSTTWWRGATALLQGMLDSAPLFLKIWFFFSTD
ncbi:hypothetical protein ABKN59_006970 [Abortiporus biennis]